MPAPDNAFAACVGRDASSGVHHMELSALTSGIRCDQGLDDFARLTPLSEQLQAVYAVIWIDQRLGCDRPNAGGDMGDAGANREEAGRDGYSELPG